MLLLVLLIGVFRAGLFGFIVWLFGGFWFAFDVLFGNLDSLADLCLSAGFWWDCRDLVLAIRLASYFTICLIESWLWFACSVGCLLFVVCIAISLFCGCG